MANRITQTSVLEQHSTQAPHPLMKFGWLTAEDVGPALESMLSCMDRLDERVRVVTDREGNVLAAGRTLDNWIERSDCLAMQERKLLVRRPAEQWLLDTLLHVHIGQIETAILKRGWTGGHCILRAAGLCAEAIAITMQLAHDSFMPKLANLEVAFGLTRSEARIVEMLQQGHGPQEIGEELGISVHTVRAHLRHCYEKLDVSSREELWQKLAPYRLN